MHCRSQDEKKAGVSPTAESCLTLVYQTGKGKCLQSYRIIPLSKKSEIRIEQKIRYTTSFLLLAPCGVLLVTQKGLLLLFIP